MTALAANLQTLETKEGWHLEAPMIASEIIYKGGPVFMRDSSGNAYAPDGTTNALIVGDVFLGFAYEKADNSSGAAEDKKVRIISRGLVKVPLAGSPTQAKVGDPVYVNDTSDDSTCTLTNDLLALGVQVGQFIEYIDSSNAYILIDGHVGKRVGYDNNGIGTVPTAEGVHRLRLAKCNYSFAVDGGAISTIGLGLTLPSGTIVLGGVIDITTTLVGATATISVDSEAAGDLKSATAVASWTAGRLALNSSTTLAASSVKTTASRQVTMTIATAALTAGVFDVYLLLANY